MSSVLVGMFDSQSAASQARTELMSAGFSADAVSMTGGSGSSAMSEGTSSSASLGSANVTSGEPEHEGAISRFFRHLFGSDSDTPSDSHRDYADTYHEAFKRGSYGVTVTAADDSELDRAEKILNDCGAVDIDEKADSWRKEGWTGGAQAAMGSAAGGMTSTTDRETSSLASRDTGTMANLEAGATRKLQEVEEQLQVGKRAIARGGVRIFNRMTEVPVTETVRLHEEHADVKRTAVDRPATEADLAAFKEGSMEVREMSEEAVVSKAARVTGEVEIGKTATEREETIHDTVRKTKVDVEQLEGARSGGEHTSGTRVEGGSSHRASLEGGNLGGMGSSDDTLSGGSTVGSGNHSGSNLGGSTTGDRTMGASTIGGSTVSGGGTSGGTVGGSTLGGTAGRAMDAAGSTVRDAGDAVAQHPVGTGVGAAAGGIAAGAAAGSVAGPVGTAVGAAVGALAGGMAGKGVAEEVDPKPGDRKDRI